MHQDPAAGVAGGGAVARAPAVPQPPRQVPAARVIADAPAAAAMIREQRATLTRFGAGSPELRALPLADYTMRLVAVLERKAAELDPLLDQLDAGQQPESNFALHPDPIAVPADRISPLLTDNAALRGTGGRGSIDWMLALPRLEAEAVPDLERRRAMGAEHDLSMNSLGRLFANASGVMRRTVGRLQSEDDQSETAQGLRAAIAALHADGTEPAVAADEMLATSLYTIELRKLPDQMASHSLYAVANLLCRLARDSSQPRPRTAAGDEVTHAEVLAMLRVYAPFIIRTDTFLCRLPQERHTLFRGVNFDFDLSLYGAGEAVAWGAMTSTSDSLRVAQGFAKGRTLVILQASSTAMIDFLSAYAHERESLLPTFTLFTSLGVTSPGLLRMLGQQGSIISLRELGDAPSAEQVVAGMIQAKQVMRELSAKFLQTYVPARVSATPPPVPDDADCLALLDGLLPQFLRRRGEFAGGSAEHLALVGDGGTGKTTALLALHCYISFYTHEFQLALPVISVFIALPKLADVQDGALIDAQVFAELGATSAEHAVEIARHATIVVLLDSLDECAVRDRDAWQPLLDGAPFCRHHCRCIVSTRSEFRDRVPAGAELFCSGGACKTMYVLPLTDADERDFIRRFCAAHEAEVDDVQRSLERLQLSDDDARLPVLLTMALEIALQDARLGAPRGVYSAQARALAEPQAGGGAAGGAAQPQQQQQQQQPRRTRKIDVAWLPAPGTRAHIFERFLDARRTASITDDRNATIDETIPLAAHQNLLKTLQVAALRMLDAGDWSVSVGSLRQRCLDAVPRSQRKQNESDNDVLLRIFGQHVPCRVEAVHDDDSAFAFWHKSLAEYLCARALFLSSSDALARLSASSFSKREPGVLRAFNDICCSDVQRRLLVSLGPLYAAVRSGSPQTRSNAFALLCAGGLPLGGCDFSNVDIADCNLQEAELSGANLRGAHITSSILRNARFDEANVERLLLRDNQYSSPLPPLEGHTTVITCVALSADGQLIASADWRGVRLWSATTGRESARLAEPTEWVWSLALSPSGDRLVSAGSDKAVRVWSTSTGEELMQLAGHSKQVRGVAFAPDGLHVASCGDDHTLRIFRLEDGELLLTLTGHSSYVNCVAYSPCGRMIATGSRDETVIIWHAASGDVRQRLRGHSTVLRSVAFSADSRRVVSGDESGKLVVWDAATGAMAREMTGHGRVDSVGFLPDGACVFSGSCRSAARLWDVASGRELLQLTGHVGAVAFSRDGRRFVAVKGERVVVNDRVTAAAIKPRVGHSTTVKSVSFFDGGRRLLTAGQEHSLRIWDVASARQIKRMHGPRGELHCAAITPDGHCAASCGDLAAADDVNGDEQFVVLLWDVASGSVAHRLRGHTRTVNSVAFSPTGDRLASGSTDRSVRVWSTSTGEELMELVEPDHQVNAVAFAPNGRSVAAGYHDRVVRVWSVDARELVHTLEGHSYSVTCVAYAPCGRVIASGGRKDIILWDAATGAERRRMTTETATTCSIAFAANSQRVVTGDDNNKIIVWDAATGIEIAALSGHSGWVTGVACSPNGAIASTGGNDLSARVTHLEAASASLSVSLPHQIRSCHLHYLSLIDNAQRLVIISVDDPASGEQGNRRRFVADLCSRLPSFIESNQNQHPQENQRQQQLESSLGLITARVARNSNNTIEIIRPCPTHTVLARPDRGDSYRACTGALAEDSDAIPLALSRQ